MLNGLDPIFIFNFSKLTPDLQEAVASIPIIAGLASKITLPPIPIYLSENLTGLYIDSEDKNIDIETTPQTLSDGEDPTVTQRGINSTVRVNMIANRNSIGMTLLSAMADLIFAKVTSKEYSITYLHGAVTVFGGLLHSFSINQNSDNELYNISIELSVTGIKKTKVEVEPPHLEKFIGAQPL